MFSAKSLGLIRRVTSLPMGLLDRIEAGFDARLDAGFTRADSLVERRIDSAQNLGQSLTRGLAHKASSTDHALAKRLAHIDAQSAARAAKTNATLARISSLTQKLEAGIDTQLNQGLHLVDSGAAICTKAGITSISTGMKFIERLDNKTEQAFMRADQRVTSVANRAHYGQVQTSNFALRSSAWLDQGIETSFNRADAAVNTGVSRSAAVAKSSITGFVATSKAFDTQLGTAVSRVDAQVAHRVNQATSTATATLNLVNAKALAFERVLELGISRIDSGIDHNIISGRAVNQSLIALVTDTDIHLTRRLARADSRLSNPIAQVALTYSKVSAYATRNFTSADTRLTNRLQTTDAGINTAVSTIVSVATATSKLATRSAQLTDAKLLRGVATVDKHVGTLIAQAGSKPDHLGKRATIASTWAVAGLALVLGTLGTATGTSVVTANSAPIEIDNSTQSEAITAKAVVSQYLEVRESFAALQASRSRSISTLESEIAQAQVRAQQTTLDGAEVIDIASKYAGVPYVWGGTTPKGFDCSGYTSYVFKQLGVKLPRTSGSQYSWSEKISAEQRQVGDLMFWSERGRVYHVAIYAGDGLMWDSPRPGRQVSKLKIWGNPTYGQVPASAINGSVFAEIAEKSAALEELKADVPQLRISVDPTPVD